MGTVSTIKGVFLLAALGASSTIGPLPYQINLFDSTSILARYREINALRNNSYQISQDESQFNIIANVSKYLVVNSKNLDKEFVDIVNKNFWDLI